MVVCSIKVWGTGRLLHTYMVSVHDKLQIEYSDQVLLTTKACDNHGKWEQ